MSVASHSAIAGSTESLRKVTRALISVSDKTGLVAIGQFLSKFGVEILSTGGSAAELKKAGVNVKEVGEHTGSPEMLNGRVKTLHPKIHGGILAVRGNAISTHLNQLLQRDLILIPALRTLILVDQQCSEHLLKIINRLLWLQIQVNMNPS